MGTEYRSVFLPSSERFSRGCSVAPTAASGWSDLNTAQCSHDRSFERVVEEGTDARFHLCVPGVSVELGVGHHPRDSPGSRPGKVNLTALRVHDSRRVPDWALRVSVEGGNDDGNLR